MVDRFISYEYIYNNFKDGDVFYDRQLRRFEFVEVKDLGMVKEIISIDEEGNFCSVYNYTKLSRILLSMSMFKRAKKWIFWDKNVLLIEQCADELLDDEHENIIDEYKKILQKSKSIIEKSFFCLQVNLKISYQCRKHCYLLQLF